jgi:hypothetical protein
MTDEELESIKSAAISRFKDYAYTKEAALSKIAAAIVLAAIILRPSTPQSRPIE